MAVLFEYKGNNEFIHHSVDEKTDVKGKFSVHMHNKFELYYFISGNATMTIEGRKVELTKGTVLIMKPGIAHAISLKRYCKYERIAFLFDRFDCKIDFDYMIFLDKNANNFVLECLNQIIKSDNINAAIDMFLPPIIYVISNNSKTEHELFSDDLVDKIIKFINSNLSGKWNLETLSKKFYVNKSSMCRKFKATVGISILEYANRKRIYSARQNIFLYRSVSKGYEKSGWDDYSSFYRQYVKIIGISPYIDLKKYLKNEINK